MSQDKQGITWGKALKGIAKIGIAIAVAISVTLGAAGVAENVFNLGEPYSKLTGIATAVGGGVSGILGEATETVTNAVGLGDTNTFSGEAMPELPEQQIAAEAVTLDYTALNQAAAELKTSIEGLQAAQQDFFRE